MNSFGKLILHLPAGEEQEFVLEKSTVTLGRGVTSDIAVSDAKVSRSHARIDCTDSGCSLVDLGSANGVSLNGLPVTGALLTPGDVIGLGDSSLRYEAGMPSSEPDAYVIDSEAELDATLAQASIPMKLVNTETPRLAIHTQARTWEVLLAQETLTIGRHESNDLILNEARASRQHARIERVGDGFRIRDLNSTNGTWLGGQPIEERLLHEGDTIQIGDARLVFKAGFGLEDLTLMDGLRSLTPSRLAQTRPPVVFVPGFMGSKLWRGSEQIWPNVKLLLTQPDVLSLHDNDPAEARGVVGEVVFVPNLLKQQAYGRMGDYLEEALSYERGKDLLEFAYDFRRDIRIAARQLAEAIDNWSVAGPITLIAHSMGTIVSRYYVEQLGGKHKIGRLILIGGPHRGYPKGVSELSSGPDLLPFGLMGDRLRQALATFPSMHQILPSRAFVTDNTNQPIDLFTDPSWLPPSQQPLLRDAQAFQRELGVTSSVPAISIFGYGLKTATGIKVTRTQQGVWQAIQMELTEQGDTAIPATSAVLAGSEIHPVQQHHGSLYVDSDVKMRLKLELTR